MMEPPYPISCVTMVLFGLSVLADSGDTDEITIAEVKKHAYDGDLIEFLTEKGGGVFASGFLEAPSWKKFRAWYGEQIRANCRSMEGRERRKYGIDDRGICLLISYTAEIIQQGKDLVLRPEPEAPKSKRIN
jgi:hypothetical protein